MTMDICEFSAAVVAALEEVGYRVHEQHDAEIDGFWWTLSRPGWMAPETGETFASAHGAWASAVEHMAAEAVQNLDSHDADTMSAHELSPRQQEQTMDDDLPGALALAQAVGKGNWPHTMDATKWADEWAKALKANPAIATDDATMVGWFANAIMAGYDTAQQRAALSQRPAGAEPAALELIVDEQQERAAFEAAAKGRMSLVRTWDDEGYDSPFTRGAYVGWKLARAAQVQRPPVAPMGEGAIRAEIDRISALKGETR